jgi:hypothetical protein
VSVNPDKLQLLQHEVSHIVLAATLVRAIDFKLDLECVADAVALLECLSEAEVFFFSLLVLFL